MCLFGCCCSSKDTTHQDIVLNKGYRSCTDTYFLLFSFLFCCGLATTTWYAFEYGDPYRIIYGSDSFGNTCGRPNKPLFIKDEENSESMFLLSGQNMTTKKFMFPLNVTRPIDTIWICVRECPKTLIYNHEGLRNESIYNKNPLCIPSNSKKGNSSLENVCPKLPVTKSIDILHRCIPEDILTIGQELINKFIEMDFVRGYLTDTLTSADLIFKMCVAAFALSFFMIYVLRGLASIVVYFIYMSVVLIFTGITASLWYSTYLTYTIHEKNGQVSMDSMTTPPPEIQLGILFKGNTNSFKDWFEFDTENRSTVLGLSIGSSVVTMFIYITVWCLLPRGKKMIVLFRKASKALWAMPCLLFQPIISALIVLIIALYSLSVILVLLTSGTLVRRIVDDGTDKNITIIENNMTETTRLMVLYQAAGFIWMCEFVLACQRLFIAGAVSMWYFNSKRNQPGQNRTVVCSALWNVFRYHLGSAAVGSFIITIVRIPRYILMWIYAKLRGVENVVLRRMLACLICALGCIERCLDYINYNAFTVIAYSGMSFCPAAKVAVNILLDNAIDVATVNSVGGAVLFLAKCMVAAATSALAIFSMDMAQLTHPWFPVLIIFVCSYMIANCFFSVYEMTIDSLFLCCVEDAELSRENPDNEFSNKEFREMISMAPIDHNSTRYHHSSRDLNSWPEAERLHVERH